MKTDAKNSFMHSEISRSSVNVLPLSILITVRSLDPLRFELTYILLAKSFKYSHRAVLHFFLSMLFTFLYLDHKSALSLALPSCKNVSFYEQV